MTTIALDIRYRVLSGASAAIQSLCTELIRLAPEGMRFLAVRYQGQALPAALDRLEAVIVPRLSAPMELIWNEMRLPGLLSGAGVNLYHGLKQCAPRRLTCRNLHTVDAIKRGSDEQLPLPLGPRLYHGWHACRAYQQSDHLLPVSEHVGRFLTGQLGIDPHRITVVHNGVGADFLKPPPAARAGAGNPLGVDAPLILCVGYLCELKNQLTVVRALARIASRVPHHLVLLGRDDPAYAQRVDQAAGEAGLAQRVHRVGFTDTETLVQFYHAADAMAHASRTEGFCLSTGEAMACGLPLVLADRGGLREQCGDAALYLDDPEDDGALATHLHRVLTEPSLHESMRCRGLRRAAELTWPDSARKTLAVYRQLLGCA